MAESLGDFGYSYPNNTLNGKFEIGENTLILGMNPYDRTDFSIYNIYYGLASKIDLVFVVTKDFKYEKIVNYTFGEKHLNNILEYVQNISSKQKKMIILDDVEITSDPLVEQMMGKSAELNISFVVISQTGNLSPFLKNKFQNVVFCKELNQVVLNGWFEKFGRGFPFFRSFADAISGLGKDEFLMIKNGDSSIVKRRNDRFLILTHLVKIIDNNTYLSITQEGNVTKKEFNILVGKVNEILNRLENMKLKL